MHHREGRLEEMEEELQNLEVAFPAHPCQVEACHHWEEMAAHHLEASGTLDRQVEKADEVRQTCQGDHRIAWGIEVEEVRLNVAARSQIHLEGVHH